MHYMYVFSFDMLTPMPSVKRRPNSFKVSNSWIKVGITNDIDVRKNSYKNEYHCEQCNKTHFHVEKVWQSEAERSRLEELEQFLKYHDELHRHRGEYYSDKDKDKIIEILNNVSFLELISE